MEQKEPTPAQVAARFKPGQSGNPSGRPKGLADLRAQCRELTPLVLKKLKRVLRHADSHAALVAAAKLVLAYGYGAPENKPVTEIEVDGEVVGKWDPRSGKELLSEIRKLRRASEPTSDAEH